MHARLRTIAAFAALVAGMAGCSGEDAPAAAPGAPGPTPSVTLSAAVTVKENGCARLLSAIGYADLVLLPAGREDEQSFDSAVRGRLAYVEGTVVLYREFLPPNARELAETLRQEVKRLVSAKTPRAEQVAALKDYRETVRQVVAACRVIRPS